MRRRFRAMAMLRAARDKLGRWRRVLTEAGSSDEDLVFHIYEFESDQPLRDQAHEPLIALGHKPFRTTRIDDGLLLPGTDPCQSDLSPHLFKRPLFACAVRRRRFPVGA